MRIAAGIEYDGTAFCGWQRQQGVRTVQEAVERAFSVVADHAVTAVCAGRTDTGVHATAQVVHFDTSARRSLRSWTLGANSNLPSEVVVRWVREVPERFHARFSARARAYRYVILNRWVRPALLRDRVTWLHHRLDVQQMRSAASLLLGRHDFSTFRALQCQAKSPVRTLHRCEVTRVGDLVYIDVEADGFLHHMVRNIAGVLMAVGKGDRDPQWVAELLALKDRTRGGVTAPPQGLYFTRVVYGPQWALPQEAVLPRFA